MDTSYHTHVNLRIWPHIRDYFHHKGICKFYHINKPKKYFTKLKNIFKKGIAIHIYM